MRRNSLTRAALLVVALVAGSVAAQGSPEQEWGPYVPSTPTPPPLPPTPPAAPAATPGASPMVSRPRVRLWQPEQPNVISMAGASPLGSWRRGELASVGFPLINLRFLMGLGDRFDLGVGFDTYYAMMNEPLLAARLCVVKTDRWAVALLADAGYAFFIVRAPRETMGARWLTGRRNVNVAPGLVFSYQGSTPRSVRISGELRYLLAIDTEPFSTTPLSGVPANFLLGHNILVTGHLELPLSATTSFLFKLGLEFHSRVNDAPVMPNIGVGIVTSL